MSASLPLDHLGPHSSTINILSDYPTPMQLTFDFEMNPVIIYKRVDHESTMHLASMLRKTFSKFYRRHYELISKYNVGLKTLLSEGLSEPEFYGDLVYKFKKLIGINDFSFQFRKIITRYRRIGYNLNVMRQSACLVFNPIMVDNYAAFFNCTPVDRASDSMMAPT